MQPLFQHPGGIWQPHELLIEPRSRPRAPRRAAECGRAKQTLRGGEALSLPKERSGERGNNLSRSRNRSAALSSLITSSPHAGTMNNAGSDVAPGTCHLHPQPSATLVAPLNWADPGGNSPRRGEQGRWMVPSGSCSSSLGSPSSSFAPRARQPLSKEPRLRVLLLPARSSPPGSARSTAVFLALEVPGGHAGNKERQPAPQPPVISRPSSILPPRPPFPSRTQAQLLCHPQPCRHHASSSLSPIPFASVPGGRPAVLLLFLFPPALPDAASPRHQGPLSAGTVSQTRLLSWFTSWQSWQPACACPSRAPSSPARLLLPS